MTTRRTIAMTVAALLSATSTARAEETPKSAASAEDGASVPGIVLMVVGAGAAAVGGTMLVVDAAREEPEPIEKGLDPGLGGARGRAGQLPLEETSALSPVGAVLLGAGALVHVVGIALVFGGSDGDQEPPPATAVSAVVGPGYGALRGSF